MAQVTVAVDVSLADCETEDLQEELEARGFSVYDGDLPMVDFDLMTRLHELLRSGQDQEAISVLRPYLLDVLGKAL